VVIHCRGHLNACRGLLLKKKHPERIRVLADLRGAISDEVSQGSRGFVGNLLTPYLRKFYERIENQVVLKSDKILSVSNGFKEFLQTRYKVNNIAVIPTFVDTSHFNFSKPVREFYRDKLGVSNRTVLVYSGGVAPWQRLEDVVSLFVNLRQGIGNLFMLFLSQEPSTVRKLIEGRIQPCDVEVIRVPHHEVGGYLCAADVGILLRENILTNKVASPIKFSEYMCCGLPCILSENIGDTAEIIRQVNAGVILNSRKDFVTQTELKRLLSLNREEIAKEMSQKYSSDIHIPEILKFYKAFSEEKEFNPGDLH
jgi:glycosyltransferase involved in cell wall biosynthesis